MSEVDIDPDQLKPALADYILDYAQSCPDRIALSSEYGDISYAEWACACAVWHWPCSAAAYSAVIGWRC